MTSVSASSDASNQKGIAAVLALAMTNVSKLVGDDARKDAERDAQAMHAKAGNSSITNRLVSNVNNWG